MGAWPLAKASSPRPGASRDAREGVAALRPALTPDISVRGGVLQILDTAENRLPCYMSITVASGLSATAGGRSACRARQESAVRPGFWSLRAVDSSRPSSHFLVFSRGCAASANRRSSRAYPMSREARMFNSVKYAWYMPLPGCRCGGPWRDSAALSGGVGKPVGHPACRRVQAALRSLTGPGWSAPGQGPADPGPDSLGQVRPGTRAAKAGHGPTKRARPRPRPLHPISDWLVSGSGNPRA